MQTLDREGDAKGAEIPSKYPENQPEAPPTIITTRVNCVHYSYNSSFVELEQCLWPSSQQFDIWHIELKTWCMVFCREGVYICCTSLLLGAGLWGWVTVISQCECVFACQRFKPEQNSRSDARFSADGSASRPQLAVGNRTKKKKKAAWRVGGLSSHSLVLAKAAEPWDTCTVNISH